MASRNRYFFTIDDLATARGADPALSYDGHSPGDFAAALQEALRSPILFERWRAMQDDPERIEPSQGATDQLAEASARVEDLHISVELVTSLPMSVVRQRLNLLIGAHWKLHDMRSA